MVDSGITIVGLGPGDLTRTPADNRTILLEAERVVVRTLEHPASRDLAARRPIETCDDLYDSADTFDDVYAAIAERVLAAAADGPVVYAVPGSPLYAERSVTAIRDAAGTVPLRVCPAPSFIDAAFEALGIDPAFTGFQVLDGRDLPDPLLLGVPALIFHVDVPIVLEDALAQLGRTVPDDTPVVVLSELGTDQASVETHPLADVPSALAGYRTSLWLDPPPVGIDGAIKAMRRLRVECPWDREQNHDSLVPFAIEEIYELVDAISHLPPGSPDVEEPDYGAYAEVEDELGDVLLQVIFHANLAAEAGAFDVSDVAERLRQKLIRRHPHVFADVDVADADEVVRNWRAIKQEERTMDSIMDGVPAGMAGLERAVKLQQRAARVGFDWPSAQEVVGDVQEELDELAEVIDQPEAADELGDVLFAAANLARHLGVEPELALRRATDRFEQRFRRIENLGDLERATVEQMNEWWEQAKGEERDRLR